MYIEASFRFQCLDSSTTGISGIWAIMPFSTVDPTHKTSGKVVHKTGVQGGPPKNQLEIRAHNSTEIGLTAIYRGPITPL